MYENKYYRYADEDYSISQYPINEDMYELISETVEKLKQYESLGTIDGLGSMLSSVKHKLEILLMQA